MSTSEQFKADLIEFLKDKVLYTVCPKKQVIEIMTKILPSNIEEKEINDELSEVTVINGNEKTVLNFHWRLKEYKDITRYNFKRYYLYKID